MDVEGEYKSRLTTAQAAVEGLPSDADIAMAMAIGQPPALLEAVAARIEDGSLSNARLWYFHSIEHAARTVLRY